MPKSPRNAKSKAKPQPGPKVQSASGSSEATQHQHYTIFRKVQLLKNLHAEAARNPFSSKAAVARNCGIHPNTATDLLRDEDEIHRLAKELNPDVAKVIARQKSRPMKAVEDLLLKWFYRQEKLHVNVTDSRLRGMAVIIWLHLYAFYDSKTPPKEIGFSAGWLANFKKRNGLAKCNRHGESGSVNLDDHMERLDEIKGILATFEPEDVYNCDETGLYLRAMSNKTVGHKGVHGHKVLQAARVSILLCSNATGSDKRKLYVLSKCRPNMLCKETLTKLDADFRGTGYMDMPRFQKWLEGFNQDMQGKSRNIALIIDGAHGHNISESLNLSNIKIVRLPPGTTALTQPMDAGIIKSFKDYYTAAMLEVVSQLREAANSHTAPVANGRLWKCLYQAWDNVTSNCIRNCFVNVPSIPNQHKASLRKLGLETKADRAISLQQRPQEQYGGKSKVISMQKDFAVLNNLHMNHCEGPSQWLTEVANELMASEEYEGQFVLHHDDDMVDDDDTEEEEEEDEEDEEEDLDYQISPSSSATTSPIRSRLRSKLLEESAFQRRYSPPTSPGDEIQKKHAKKIMNNFLDVLQQPGAITRYSAVLRTLEACIDVHKLHDSDYEEEEEEEEGEGV